MPTPRTSKEGRKMADKRSGQETKSEMYEMLRDCREFGLIMMKQRAS